MISSRRRLAAALCLLAGISVGALLRTWVRTGPADPHTLARIGRPLPPLIVDGSGAAVDLRKIIAGRRGVIVFYSASCRICREELPSLKPFPDELRLIMVSETRTPGDRMGSEFPDALLFYDRWNVLYRAFALAAVPTIIFIDEDGILRGGLVGSHRREVLQKKLKEFASRPVNGAFSGLCRKSGVEEPGPRFRFARRLWVVQAAGSEPFVGYWGLPDCSPDTVSSPCRFQSSHSTGRYSRECEPG